MRPNLTPQSPLSQVVFVHDYLQLVFQGERLSIYNPCSLTGPGLNLQTGDPGFCDALVSLIGQTASACADSSELLSLSFSGGVVLAVLPDQLGLVEAFTFHSEDSRAIVERNA
jgi:hypothetical protein